jgi:hypothetical protein
MIKSIYFIALSGIFIIGYALAHKPGDFNCLSSGKLKSYCEKSIAGKFGAITIDITDCTITATQANPWPESASVDPNYEATKTAINDCAVKQHSILGAKAISCLQLPLKGEKGPSQTRCYVGSRYLKFAEMSGWRQ